MKIFNQKSLDYEALYSFQPSKLARMGKKLKNYYTHITYPMEISLKLDDLIGKTSEKENIEDALFFLKSIGNSNENSILCHSSRYIIVGESGSGKETLVRALAKSADVPYIFVNASIFGTFPKKIKQIIDLIFDIAETLNTGCVLNIDNFDAALSLGDNNASLFSNHFISRVVQNTNTVIFLSSLDSTVRIPNSFVCQNGFNTNKLIVMTPPTLEERREFINNYIAEFKIPVSDDFSIETLARNTFGMMPKKIKYLMQDAALMLMRKEKDVLTSRDMNDLMISEMAGEVSYKLTEEERISTAYHEAGHVIAAYYSNPEYKLGRVEITPRAESLGLTLENQGEDKFGHFKSDLIRQIIYSLGGMAAEMLIYGESTTGVCADLSSATNMVTMMYQNFGMSKNLGPIVIDEECGLCSNSIVDEAERYMQADMKMFFDLTFSIVKEHQTQLESLTKALLKKEVLIENEIKTILDEVDKEIGNYPPKILDTKTIVTS